MIKSSIYTQVGIAEGVNNGLTTSVNKIFVQDETDKSCMDYRIDLEAAAFGQCKCGLPRSAHKEDSIQRGKNSNKELVDTPSI